MDFLDRWIELTKAAFMSNDEEFDDVDVDPMWESECIRVYIEIAFEDIMSHPVTRCALARSFKTGDCKYLKRIMNQGRMQDWRVATMYMQKTTVQQMYSFPELNRGILAHIILTLYEEHLEKEKVKK